MGLFFARPAGVSRDGTTKTQSKKTQRVGVAGKLARESSTGGDKA
jgi:hypothetical protein